MVSYARRVGVLDKLGVSSGYGYMISDKKVPSIPISTFSFLLNFPVARWFLNFPLYA